MTEFTEQFIRMAMKAEEVQKVRDHVFIEGDYCYCKECGLFIHTEGRLYDFDGIIWLPLPHQSLEMVGVYAPLQFIRTLTMIGGLGRRIMKPEYQFAESWAELCLAFLYHAKYNKVWDGEDWVKEA